jgi:hypothetical protein
MHEQPANQILAKALAYVSCSVLFASVIISSKYQSAKTDFLIIEDRQ